MKGFLLAAALTASGFWWIPSATAEQPGTGWRKWLGVPYTQTAAAAPGSLPDVSLTDEMGRPFRPSDLKGKPWIASFIFTSCAGECPLIVEQMRRLQDRLPSEIRLVSFTVDPKRDTPKVLADYARKNGAQPGRWRFVTGDSSALGKLSLEGFRLAFAEEGTGGLTHSVRLALVDREGVVHGTYDSTDPKAIERLVREAQDLAR